jgi:minor extracellular serine protease Vpr
MGKRKERSWLSSVLVFLLIFSLYNPVVGSVAAEKTTSTETIKQMSKIINDQKAALKKGAVLHPDLQNLTGDEDVAVIVQLSEPPIAMVEGMSKLSGKKFTSTMEKEAKEIVTAQQQNFKKEMTSKGLKAKVGFNYYYAFNGMSLKVKASQVADLMALSGVQLVEPDLEVQALGEPNSEAQALGEPDSKVQALSEPDSEAQPLNDPDASDTFTPAVNTSVPHLGIPELWSEGIEGQNVKVAVLDTGIDYHHPEFEGVYKGGYNFVNQSIRTIYKTDRFFDDPYETSPAERSEYSPEVSPTNGSLFWTTHGTSVAGIIAAQGKNAYGIKGLAPKIELYAYRVLGAYGSGFTSGIIAGIDKAAQENIDVMNLSFRGNSMSSTASDSIAVNNATLAGTIAVTATGNNGPNRSTIGNPATAAFSIAVANSTVPVDVHSSDIQVTLNGNAPTTYPNVELMGTKFGINPGAVLTGEYDLVAVPNLGKPEDYYFLDVKGKIALVARGETAFVDKIAAAKAAGAVGVIIHNSATGAGTPGPSTTQLGDLLTFIPTYNMSYTDGTALRTALASKSAKVTFSNFSKRVQAGDDIHNSSSRGPSTPSFDIKPDVSAPGTNIMSSIAMYKKDYPNVRYDESYNRYTGTTFAAPHVTGIVALVKSAHPDYSPFDLKVAVTNTAKQLDVTKYDVFSQGAGLVQPYKAVHAEALAYSMDKVTFGRTTHENIKGTITYGNVPTGKANSITKEVRVKNLTGNPSDYNVSVQVTKVPTGELAAASVTVDQSSFTLSDEQLLKVTLSYPEGTGVAGMELLGYVHITNGKTKLSLPFAANFAPPTESFSADSRHISPNGDGKLDSTTIRYEFQTNQGRTFLELWDAKNQNAGTYGDGWIGWIAYATETNTGPKTVTFDGTITPWEQSVKILAPDGVYSLDLSTPNGNTGNYFAQYSVGPFYVKSTPATIHASDLSVEGATATYNGSVSDSYVDWKELVEEVYGEDYDVNDNLHVKFELHNTAGDLVASQPITLAADGTFSLNLAGLTEGANQLTFIVDDEAQNHAEKVVTITSTPVVEPEPEPDPDPVPTLDPGQGLLIKGTEPMANITFSAHSMDEQQVWYDFTTDEDGVFTHDLPDGTYHIVGVWADPLWHPINKTFTIKDGFVNGTPLVVNVLNYQLPPADQYNVKGLLKNGTKAVANVPFSVRTADGSEWYAARTNSKGEFVLNLPNGEYVVEGIWIDTIGKWYVLNKAFTVEEGSLVGGATLALDLATATNKDNITGTLTKGATPVANVTFSFHTGDDWYNVRSDANGNFSTYASDGTYVVEGVWVGAEGKWYVLNKAFTIEKGSMVVGAALALDLDAASNKDNITGTLTKGATPVADITFSFHASDDWYNVRSDANGNFSTYAPDGTYVIEGVWVGAEGKWYVLNKTFTIEKGRLVGGAALALDLDAASNKDNITGSLTKGATPVANVTFSFHAGDDWYNARSDANGNFSTYAPDGTYVIEGVWVGSEGKWYVLEQTFTVKDGKLEGATLLINLP